MVDTVITFAQWAPLSGLLHRRSTTPTESSAANHTCDRIMVPGEWLADGRCDICYRFRREHSRDRIVSTSLALADNLIVDGAYAPTDD